VPPCVAADRSRRVTIVPSDSLNALCIICDDVLCANKIPLCALRVLAMRAWLEIGRQVEHV
jgi:hypothetical protein